MDLDLFGRSRTSGHVLVPQFCLGDFGLQPDLVSLCDQIDSWDDLFCLIVKTVSKTRKSIGCCFLIFVFKNCF